jgi:hypothetical protein
MALSVWTKPSGYNLGHIPGYGYTTTPGKIVVGREYVIVANGDLDFTNIGAANNDIGTIFTATSAYRGTGSLSETLIQEQTLFNKPLPTQNDAGVTYTVISGSLPLGLIIDGNLLKGTPREVADYTTFTFCIRASKNGEISDRTFKLAIDGPDNPNFITSAGLINIGIHQQLYALDRTYVEYQLDAFDLDTATGQKLTYFIASEDGKLPPGVTMSPTGFISGFIKPNPKITPESGTGTYDNTYYDKAGYDFAQRPTNGFDSYLYDKVFFDYSTPFKPSTTINVNYQFKVTVTDGNSYAQRIFKIFVIGDDQFRADNLAHDSEVADFFTADVTYLREPAWLSKSNIGLFRANNYLTVPLSLYDAANVIFSLELTNKEVECTTVNLLPTDNIENSTALCVNNVVGTIEAGQWCAFEDIVLGATDQLYKIYTVTPLGNGSYRLTISPGLKLNIPNETKFYIGSLSTLPRGTSFDPQTATIYGTMPYQPAITINYNFTITATRIGDKGDTSVTSRTFTIGIIGEIDSVITWNTNSNLGSINANFVSNLNVSATSTVANAVVIYNLISGKLPSGLTLNTDGEIVGKVNQFYDKATGTLGITRFFECSSRNPVTNECLIDSIKTFITFDGDKTTFDKQYTFEIEARDQYDYSATTKTFTLTVDTPNLIRYSNIRGRPFLKTNQRDNWKSFINDSNIFTPSSIYRTNDPYFGIQTELSMMVYAGIETKEAATYVSAVGLNHKKKRFAFGKVKSATAYNSGTKNAVYEVVYIEMKDLSEPNGKYLPPKITVNGLQSDVLTIDNSLDFWSRSINVLSSGDPDSARPNPVISVDNTGYAVSNSQQNTFYPNSITNWRKRIKNWKADPNNINSTGFSTERNYLPLWMRSIQPGTSQELGFVLAVPICYCKIGASADIILNIEHSGFDFKTLDYTIDRYIIDAVEEQASDKYIVFKNDRIVV